MDVHIDQAGGDNQPLRINRLVNLAQRLAAGLTNRHDQPVTYEQIINPVNTLTGINHAATTDQHRRHQTILLLSAV